MLTGSISNRPCYMRSACQETISQARRADLTNTRPVSKQSPVSSTPLPFHRRCMSTTSNDFSMNSRTECVSLLSVSRQSSAGHESERHTWLGRNRLPRSYFVSVLPHWKGVDSLMHDAPHSFDVISRCKKSVQALAADRCKSPCPQSRLASRFPM